MQFERQAKFQFCLSDMPCSLKISFRDFFVGIDSVPRLLRFWKWERIERLSSKKFYKRPHMFFKPFKNTKKKIKTLFAGLGRSVLTKTAPSVLSTQGLWHSFSQYVPTKAGK